MDEFDTTEEMQLSAAPLDDDYFGTFEAPSEELVAEPSCGRGGLRISVARPGRHDLVANARQTRHLIVKRVFDATVAATAIIALLPLFIILAAIIKVNSKGPVFFLQKREGQGGKPFTIYKFRSLKIEHSDLSGIKQTVEDDNRLTAVGRFIRRTSIDELPQLFNVLVGDMSLVGPRPHVPNMLAGGMAYTELVPYYHRRLDVRPGLTGWAQVNGLRGPTASADLAKARIDHDLAYIDNFSFWLDLRIIFWTLRHEFLRGTGR